MILGGVFERFPNLKFTITEAGCAWIPEFLTEQLDDLMAGIRSNKVGEMRIGGELVPPKSATEYFQQNCYVGVSQPRPLDIAAGARRPGRHRPHHVGQRLPPRRGHLPVHHRAPPPGHATG